MDAVCEEAASEREKAELNEMLLDNETSRSRYLNFCWLHVALEVDAQAQKALDASRRSHFDSSALAPWESEAIATLTSPGLLPASVPAVPAISTFQAASGFFSSGWPVAYLVATAICAIGLVIGAIIHVSEPTQIVGPSTPLPSPSSPRVSMVGRVTAMVDCVLNNDQRRMLNAESRTQKTDIHPSSCITQHALIHMGDRLALRSGLLELTYDTGARVILQGPVTYEVESPAGGFLSVGKLTARLDSHSEISNHQSEIVNHKFVVRTPTATVTDLGTEFGVEVSKEGNTVSHVFRGIVEVQPTAKNGKPHGRSVRLIENESVHIDKQSADAEITVQRGKNDAAAFVRAEQFLKLASGQRQTAFDRWQSYSQALRRDPSLLAYYDFQQKEGSPAVLPNMAANGDHALDGAVANATWSTGRMPGKHALLFQNRSDCVRFSLPQSTSDLTLAAWVCFDAFDSSFHAASGLLMSEGQNAPAGICWQVRHRDGCLSLSLLGDGIAVSPAIDHKAHRWVHLASVYDRSAHQVRFFVDGRCVGSGDLQRNDPVTIGTARVGNRDSQTSQVEFRGLMDELVIVGRTLTADEIQQMCREGQPPTVGKPASRSLVRSFAKPFGPGVELVCNGGFEAAHPGGVEGGWFHEAAGWDVVTAPFQAYTGSPHSGQFRGAVWDGGVGTQKHFYANGFAPNVASLAFHGWAKAEVAGGIAHVSVTVGNMTGDVFVVHDARSFTIAETKWTEVAGELAVQHGSGTNLTNYMEIRLMGEGTAPHKASQFDDLSLVTAEKKSSRQ
jgi:hypothetical protein